MLRAADHIGSNVPFGFCDIHNMLTIKNENVFFA
jgi:hypothetical protein